MWRVAVAALVVLVGVPGIAEARERRVRALPVEKALRIVEQQHARRHANGFVRPSERRAAQHGGLFGIPGQSVAPTGPTRAQYRRRDARDQVKWNAVASGGNPTTETYTLPNHPRLERQRARAVERGNAEGVKAIDQAIRVKDTRYLQDVGRPLLPKKLEAKEDRSLRRLGEDTPVGHIGPELSAEQRAQVQKRLDRVRKRETDIIATRLREVPKRLESLRGSKVRFNFDPERRREVEVGTDRHGLYTVVRPRRIGTQSTTGQ